MVHDNNLAYGEINEDCECVEIQGCNDFEVSTILLSNDDGTAGSVEAIVSGGLPLTVMLGKLGVGML